MERIDLGLKHRIKMTDEERRMTAYHEAGHIIVTYFLHPYDDVFKASIIPRKVLWASCIISHGKSLSELISTTPLPR